MRYDTPVFFQTVLQGVYEPSTGNYGEDTVTEVKQYVSVSASNTETMNLVYGKLRQDSLTIQLQNHFKPPFTCIRVGKTTYHVDRVRNLVHKQVLIVSEVP